MLGKGVLFSVSLLDVSRVQVLDMVTRGCYSSSTSLDDILRNIFCFVEIVAKFSIF